MMKNISRISAWAGISAYSAALLSPNLLLFYFDMSSSSIMKLVLACLLLATWYVSFQRISAAIMFSLPFFLLLPLDLFFTITYHEPPTTPVLVALRETNLAEAADFMRGREIFVAVLILASLAVWWLGLYVARRHERVWSVPRTLRRTSVAVLGLLATAVAIFTLAPVMEGQVQARAAVGAEVQIAARIDSGLTESLVKVKGIFPFGRFISVAEFFREELNFQNANARKEHFRFGARQIGPALGRQIFVLVIGEAARADHWQLNGYPRPTSPRLAAEPNVIALRDIVSPSSYTNRSVPVILTRVSGTFDGRVRDEKSIVSAFREAGFRTYWISNQPPIGSTNTTITYFAREADESFFVNSSSNAAIGVGKYDEAVLSPLAGIIARNEPKQFLVIHLLGSHDAYQRRYPDSFDIFKPSLKTMETPDHHDAKNKIEVVNSYDNSMLYTDFVLSKIIESVRATGAVASVLYVADHGEDLFDGTCARSGHGSSSKQQFPIAAMAWTSDKYNSTWPDKAAIFRANANRKLTTENVFPSLLDLASVSFDQMDFSRSLSARGFSEHQRLVNAPEPIDWDTAKTHGACDTLVAR